MKGFPKNLIPMHLDQIMFECWANLVMEFSAASHSTSEQQKCSNTLLFFITTLSEFYCGDDFKWEQQDNFVSDGCKIKIDKGLHDYCKDQGCALNDEDKPVDDVMEKEAECEHNPDDFNFEVDDDSDDSTY